MEHKPRLIAITGGIGAGKSIVSHILRLLGYAVYDTDSEAKRLMDSSETIKAEIAAGIDNSAIDDSGNINRKRLAEIVFNNPEKLATLNTIVHAAVRNDIRAFASAIPDRTVFVETAILYQSKIDRMVDAVWEVTASDEVRIQRVMKRNSLTAEEVAARIRSQHYIPEKTHDCVKVIVNDDTTPVLPQVERLVAEL